MLCYELYSIYAGKDVMEIIVKRPRAFCVRVAGRLKNGTRVFSDCIVPIIRVRISVNDIFFDISSIFGWKMSTTQKMSITLTYTQMSGQKNHFLPVIAYVLMRVQDFGQN